MLHSFFIVPDASCPIQHWENIMVEVCKAMKFITTFLYMESIMVEVCKAMKFIATFLYMESIMVEVCKAMKFIAAFLYTIVLSEL